MQDFHIHLLANCLSKDETSSPSGTGKTAAENGITNARAFDGKNIGIKTGSSFEQPTMDFFPNSQYSYLDTDTDLMTSLKSEKIDGYLSDEPIARMVATENPDLTFFETPLADDDYYFGFQKQTERSRILLGQFNEMLKDMWAS